MTDTNDAQVIVDTATAAAAPKPLGPDMLYSVVVPQGAKNLVVDLQTYQDRPRRARGTVRLADTASLVEYTLAHGPAATTAIYADLAASTVTAVLNDHDGTTSPGWGDHRAVLALAKTVEWLRWEGHDNTWLTQFDFATHIEESQADVVDPPAGQMLDIAQTFQANVGADFKTQNFVGSGQRQLVWSETVQASAGAKGDLTIPTDFHLALWPYEGMAGPKVPVAVRLQFKVRDHKLAIRYLIDRPHDILKAVFAAAAAEVAAGTHYPTYQGAPPAVTAAAPA